MDLGDLGRPSGATLIVFTESGPVGEAESAAILAAGVGSLVRLGWALAEPQSSCRAHVQIDAQAVLPAVARSLADWLATAHGSRVTVDAAGEGRLIEFLDGAAAARWIGELAKTARRDDMAGWARALAATWIDQDGKHVPSLSDLLVRPDPDTACFALQTMGCIALRWAPHPVDDARESTGGSVVEFGAQPNWKGPSGVPACVMVDPRSLRKAALGALRVRLERFGELQVALEWYDGVAWIYETSSCDVLADRLDRLRRMFQESGLAHGLRAVEAELGMLRRLAEKNEDARSAMELLASWNAMVSSSASLEEVDQLWPALLTGPSVRAKLMRVDVDGGLTFLRYHAGPRNFYDRNGDDRVLAGRTLEAVPNPSLAEQLVKTARRLRKDRTPLLERVSGQSWSIFEGPLTIDYWRLSIPVGRGKLEGVLVLTGGWELTRLENPAASR